MGTSDVTAVSSSDRTPEPSKALVKTTESRTITFDAVTHYVEATGDSNAIHLNDMVAQEYGLARRVVPAKQIQGIALDLIVRREAGKNYHPVLAEDTWRHPEFLYVEETIFVRYSRTTKMGLDILRAEVYVNRGRFELVVATGKIFAKLMVPDSPAN
jgi:acyl dehydratase